MPPGYAVRLMFEWGGGCLWCGNEAALDIFGVGPIEHQLPLTPELRRRLEELSAWHDTALNWDNPSEPGPWAPEEHDRFDQAAHMMLKAIRSELGAEFEIVYEGDSWSPSRHKGERNS